MRGTWWRVLACAMAIALCVGVGLGLHREARAADSYTITVSDVKAGSTYTAYKVFDVVYSGNNYAYTISSSNPFFSAVQNSGLFNLEEIGQEGSNKTYSVALKDATTTDTSALAAALKGVQSKGAAADTQTAPSTVDDNTKVTLNVTASGAGYYFVETTTGTICSLDTTNPTAEVRDKNSKPSIDKKVQEPQVSNGDFGYVDQNDANVGDTVNFRIKVTVVEGGENYVIHDKLAPGLTLDQGSFKLGITPDPAEASSSVPIGYENGFQTTFSGLTDDCTFEITLSNALHQKFLTDANVKSRDLYIFYTATLNQDAVVGAAGNPNETYLSYGGTNKTEKSVTKTYTWPLEVVKYTGNDASKNRLANAKFTLTKATVANGVWTADGNALKFNKSASSNTYTLASNGTSSEITTDSTGVFQFSGLDSGTYLLTETEAPAGYNKLAKPIEVTIGVDYDMTALTMNPTYATNSTSGTANSNTGSVTLGSAAGTQGTVYVQNRTGAELPATGGIGTTILYVAGGLLVVGALGGLVVKRRASRG